MKRKTINAIITKRMKEWWATIEDEELRKLVERDTIITGGCIASMFLNEKVSDFDVYFAKRETAFLVAKHYVEKFIERRKTATGQQTPVRLECGDEPDGRIKIVVKSAGIAGEDGSGSEYDYFESRPPEEAGAYVGEVMDDPGEIEDTYEATQEAAQENEDETFRPVFLSTNAITLSQRVQIIVRFWGDPDEIHSNYDFIHCTNYWTKKTGVVVREGALEALLTKELRYVGSKYPVCSVFRIRKFVQRGWTINAGQILKICHQISELDLNNLEVLEEQLTGVDVAYFAEVIQNLKAKDKERVDSAYLVEIIDRMF